MTAEPNQTTHEEIKDLGDRLDQTNLSEKQKALLSAIITKASEKVDVETPLPNRTFAEQFKAAYTPSYADTLLSFGANHVGRSVGRIPPHPAADPGVESVGRKTGAGPDSVGRHDDK